MNHPNRTHHQLSLVFIAWIVLANSLLLLSPTASVIDHWLGAGVFWASLIPLTCLVWLNPRRSWGLLLAAAGLGVLLMLRIGRPLTPKRVSIG